MDLCWTIFAFILWESMDLQCTNNLRDANVEEIAGRRPTQVDVEDDSGVEAFG